MRTEETVSAHSRRGYPRPLLRRREWFDLCGDWEFALDAAGSFNEPAELSFERRITVPFAPETARSGIADLSSYRACWYRRSWLPPPLERGQQLVLHFGAVDYLATVYCDGRTVACHEGGYTPFSVDLTRCIQPGKPAELVLRVEDDPADLAKPRGKQDWQTPAHSIWYPRTTGIWQTVWCERVPTSRIDALEFSTSLERWEVALRARVIEQPGQRLRLSVRLRAGGQELAADTYSVTAGEVHRRIALSDPGIDDSRNTLLWSPESPTLIQAELELLDAAGGVIDRVESYTALRTFSAKGHRLLLNGRPYPLRLVLDQGYWPETGATAPDDRALRRDIELTKAMGFNGARKHQKIEDPRYLYWADRLGLLVFEEMPSAYRFTKDSVERLVRQWLEVLRRDASHPCIVAWVPFNESWGVPNLPESRAERDYVQALYHLTKTLDPGRLVLGNDGWESVATDIIGIHDYDPDPARITARYGDRRVRPQLLSDERPGGRALVIGRQRRNEHPILLSEFGGIACSDRADSWGYSNAGSAEELDRAYTALLAAVHDLKLLSGFCYTQLTDTYQEANGLLFADRSPKFPIDRIRAATLGRLAKFEPSTGEPSAEPFEVP
jgi:beta-galactosidase/beta-glucuronidase